MTLETATVNGCRLAYRIDGPAAAPWLLLHHPLATDHTFWDDVTPALAARYRVVRFDARGHGRSDATPAPYTMATLTQDVVGLMDHLAIDRAGYVGLSMGGMVAQMLGAMAPDRIVALVIAASSSKVAPEMKHLWRDRVIVARAQGMGSQVAPALGRWITEASRASRPDLVTRCTHLIEATPVEGYAGWCAAIETMDLTPFHARVMAPTLVLAGALDPGTPPSACEVIRAGVPGAVMTTIPDVAHMIAIEAPVAFLAAVEPFLMRHL